jgi:hypothetical protein
MGTLESSWKNNPDETGNAKGFGQPSKSHPQKTILHWSKMMMGHCKQTTRASANVGIIQQANQ